MSGLFADEPPPEVATTDMAYRVLARKYRPTSFDELIGQDALVRTLRSAFALDRVAHAFMLTGVRGVGKTTTARIIARAMNCVGVDGKSGPTADPCGVCANCVAILADRHPDVVEMDAASNTGVDDVREIIEATRFRPMQARTKTFIIDEVHMLSRNAFNALLKTLEEPPPHVKFVFATTELRKVPVTVLSRCQRFDLKRVSLATLSAHFSRIAAREAVTVEPEGLDLIARAADGSVRDGLSLLDQAITRASRGVVSTADVIEMLGRTDRSSVFDLLEAVFAGRPEQALAITDRAHVAGTDFGWLLQDLLELVHTLTRLKTVPELSEGSTTLPEAERVRGGRLASALSIPVLARAWQMLLKGVAEVEMAPDRRAAAEMVLIRLCYVSDQPSPAELIRRIGENRAPSAPQPAPSVAVAPALLPALAPEAGGSGVRSVVNGAAVLPPEPQRANLSPASFREVAQLVSERREATLHAHLLHSVHLVRFAPGVIELRPEANAPRDLASRLAALLLEATGTRWTIALSAVGGEATLAQQGQAAEEARRVTASEHPLVRAILHAFPGARIAAVHDGRLDAYGLLQETRPGEDGASAPLTLEPDMPEFAPDDATFVENDLEDDA
jgi:DNA polymerase-3 subunit gamma/tau